MPSKEQLYAGALIASVTYLVTEEPTAVIVALILCVLAMFTERIDS